MTLKQSNSKPLVASNHNKDHKVDTMQRKRDIAKMAMSLMRKGIELTQTLQTTFSAHMDSMTTGKSMWSL